MAVEKNRLWFIPILTGVCVMILCITSGVSASDTVNLDSTAPANPEDASAFQTIFSPGAAMRPRSSDTDWQYYSGGCVYDLAGSDWFTVHANLPDGSIIEFVTLYYYDNAVGNVSGALSAYDGAGGLDDISVLYSSGTPGYGNVRSGYLGETVDTTSNSYALLGKPGTDDNTNRLCGVKVQYISGLALFADNFESGNTTRWD